MNNAIEEIQQINEQNIQIPENNIQQEMQEEESIENKLQQEEAIGRLKVDREGNWKCGVCGKKYQEKRKTIQHLAIKHTQIPKGWKEYYCPYCPKKYKEKRDLTEHIGIIRRRRKEAWRNAICEEMEDSNVRERWGEIIKKQWVEKYIKEGSEISENEEKRKIRQIVRQTRAKGIQSDEETENEQEREEILKIIKEAKIKSWGKAIGEIRKDEEKTEEMKGKYKKHLRRMHMENIIEHEAKTEEIRIAPLRKIRGKEDIQEYKQTIRRRLKEAERKTPKTQGKINQEEIRRKILNAITEKNEEKKKKVEEVANEIFEEKYERR